MVEAMENSIRSDLDALYVQKTRQILSSVRSTVGGSGGGAVGRQNLFAGELRGAIGMHGERRGAGLAEKVAAMGLRP
ncbi:unnamed protein product [Discosporangium mesarthrocarpum]